MNHIAKVQTIYNSACVSRLSVERILFKLLAQITFLVYVYFYIPQSYADPTYIILEYACHGSLKQYLVSCRTTVLELGSDLHVDSFNECELLAVLSFHSGKYNLVHYVSLQCS